MITITIIIIIAELAAFLRGQLPHLGKAQMACDLMLPHKDNILNKILKIRKERHNIIMRKLHRLPGWTKNSSYYTAPGRCSNSQPQHGPLNRSATGYVPPAAVFGGACRSPRGQSVALSAPVGQ